MSAEYATFALAPAIRPGGIAPDGSPRAHRKFLDFVVDGRPLLFRFPDLDAVSSLASDVPPAALSASVRGLLLDAGAPPAGGRHTLYGCPDHDGRCHDAVTAVVDRDGEDIVWRDVARRTGGSADLHVRQDIGPYRFRGDLYRAELERLLPTLQPAGPAESTARGRRALLFGARTSVLHELAAALDAVGVGSGVVPDTTGMTDAEKRGYGAVVFGRAVPEAFRRQVRDDLTRAGAVDVAYLEGFAPVIPVLVAQILSALDPTPPERRRLSALAAVSTAATVEISQAVGVQLVAHRLDPLHRTHTKVLFEGVLEPGTHRIPFDAKAAKGESFLVARTTGGELVVPVGP
ncbi:oxidoreductase [Streptomyces sp. Je 1-79]|uniref:oxidoreductase n=1 Tax=Streptomyces sp. Je 1-79 TaxID=2943847 RepID=UPI0021A337FD|nr:oxidoreductase [Streptomyces sp. Je 1-79]MCT4353262.1 oxidoreductase [Streptomyces sp. Je 1-79]